MKKERTKHVRSWDELIKFVESINLYEKTIMLTGWVGEVVEEDGQRITFPMRALLFSTRPINILRSELKNGKLKRKKKNKRSK